MSNETCSTPSCGRHDLTPCGGCGIHCTCYDPPEEKPQSKHARAAAEWRSQIDAEVQAALDRRVGQP